jgi:Ca-activated chloride channel family protein
VFAPLAGAYLGLLRNVEGFRFAHPWLLALIPPAVALVLWMELARGPARRGLFLHSRAAELGAQRPGLVARLRDLPTVLRLAAVVLIVVAAARPQSTRTTDDLEVEGIDIVVALDLSGSMQETDLVPNRLEAAKAVLKDFIRRRPTDRIGLVVFGREAYTYAPMTLDHAALLRMVAELHLNVIDGSGTAIGDGIAVALNRLCGEELRRMTEAAKAAAQAPGAGAQPAPAKPPELDGRSKVLIVLTDGEDNASKLSPEDAARLAQTLKVKIYTILAGAKETEQDGKGGPGSVNPKLLEQIASMTGGTPYLASDSRALGDRFQKILAELRRAPIHDRGTLYAELYRRFLLVAFALLALEIALRLTRFSRIP